MAALDGVHKLAGHVKSILVDEHDGLLIEPLNTFSVLPKSVLDGALRTVNVSAKAVLLALVPVPFILAAISPVVKTVALFLIV